MSLFDVGMQVSPAQSPIRVCVLGASGSVGRQTLDVCRRHRDKVEVTALAVNDSTDFLVEAAREFGATHVACANCCHKNDPAFDELPKGCSATFGEKAVADLAYQDDVDCVVNAVVGFAGIHAAAATLRAGKTLLSANKESLVVGGDVLMPLVHPNQLLPIDSEHSAIFQCLVGERRQDVRRLWLTCSGGPFFGRSRSGLANVTAQDALRHPTWKMGPKITIDCATLMNKGLEILEACRLFDVQVDEVCVLIHRQSIIHSMVEFSDGVVKAQLGPSDMRLPIQYALSFPERWEGPATPIDWREAPGLSFDKPDEEVFGCLGLAREAGRRGGTLPCVMNAAGEVANQAFRQGRCGFLDIERVVGTVMEASVAEPVSSLEQLEEVDAASRARAEALISGGVL